VVDWSLFRHVYGPKAERALDVFVTMNALGNVLNVVNIFLSSSSTSFDHYHFFSLYSGFLSGPSQPTLLPVLWFKKALQRSFCRSRPALDHFSSVDLACWSGALPEFAVLDSCGWWLGGVWDWSVVLGRVGEACAVGWWV